MGKSLKASVVDATSSSSDVAIIGMACRVPGADSYSQFWDNLCNGVNSVTEIPLARWDWRDCFGDKAVAGNESVSKWGGFINNTDQFDAPFFGISPREAQDMDPQQRILLELAWQCIEDSGYRPKTLSGENIGVYIGACNFDYKTLQEKYCATVDGHVATGNLNAILPNRISYFFNFHGPSIAVDTACASSLVALQQAVSAIRANECSAALVGGISILTTPDRFIAFSKMGMLSPTGSCKTFDQSADGYVRSEGGGLIFLKSLHQALRDNDKILGVIKGVAVNHGGRARSLTAPSALAQSKVITASMRQAGVDPSTLGYVETHGTGTPLGDPIEILGLTRAFERGARRSGESLKTGYCALGALKTNIGHLESAAGIVGIIKVLLAMKHKLMPANFGFDRLNPRIKLDNSPFYVLARNTLWQRQFGKNGEELPLRAGVSSFGVGGVNSHVIIEEAPLTNVDEAGVSVPKNALSSQLLLLSAFTKISLRELARSYARLLRNRPGELESLCATSNFLRTQMPVRLAIVAVSADEMIVALEEFANTEQVVNGASFGDCNAAKTKIGLSLTGLNSTFGGMGRDLFSCQPAFREAAIRCDALFKPLLGRPVTNLIFSGDQSHIDDPDIIHPAQFTFEYSLLQLLEYYGVKPSVIAGYRMSDVVAACMSAKLTLEEAVRVVASRSRVLANGVSRSAAVAVKLACGEVQKFLDSNRILVNVTAGNDNFSAVIWGANEEIEKAIGLFSLENIEVTLIEVHESYAEDRLNSIRDFSERNTHSEFDRNSVINLISSETGLPTGTEFLHPNYWIAHLSKPPKYHQGVCSMMELGVDFLLDIGSPFALEDNNSTTKLAPLFSLLPNNDFEDMNSYFLMALAELFSFGCEITFPSNRSCTVGKGVDLPVYTFCGQSYWTPRSKPVNSRGNTLTNIFTPLEETLLGARLNLPLNNTVCYAVASQDKNLSYLLDHCILGNAIMPGAAYIAMALAAARPILGAELILTKVKFSSTLQLASPSILQTVFFKDTGKVEIWSRPTSDSSVDLSHELQSEVAWSLNASAIVGVGAQFLVGQEHIVPPEGESIAAGELYAKMAQQGLQYGPSFQAVTSLVLRGNQSFARIALPPLSGDCSSCAVNPALLDAVIQTIIPLLPQDTSREGALPIPCGLDELKINGALPNEFMVKAEIISADNDLGIYRCNFVIFSLTGSTVATISGLELRRLVLTSQARSALAPADHLSRMLYRPTWVPASPLTTAASVMPCKNDANSKTLVIYTPPGIDLAEALGATLQSHNMVFAAVGLHAPFSSAPFYSIGANQNQDFNELLATHPGIDTIYFLGAFHMSEITSTEDSGEFDHIENTQEQGVLLLFHLIKSLQNRFKLDTEITLKIVTNGVCAIRPDDRLIPWGASTHGLAKVLSRENPLVNLTIIDLDASLSEKDLLWSAQQIAAESARENGSIVAYRQRNKFIRGMEPVTERQVSSNCYRTGGVYLIVGGAGGIGFKLSLHLAQNFGATLIWVGRSPMDEVKRMAMAEIEQLGGKVNYYQADVCNLSALRQVVTDVTGRYGTIHGVIHSALALHDQLLTNMEVETFSKGMDPKIKGSWVLHQATKHLSLDFLLFFSSAVTFFSNPGQANYIAGCTFQDAFAHYLNHHYKIPVKIINWGRWGEIGAAAAAGYAKKLSALGFFAIEPSEGVALTERTLTLSDHQIIAIKAEPHVLAEMGCDPGYDKANTELNRLSAPTGRVSAEEILSLNHSEDSRDRYVQIFAYFCEELAATLRLDRAEIERGGKNLSDRYLSELGVDSLTAMELRNRLRKHLNVNLSVEMLLGNTCIEKLIDSISDQLALRQLVSKTHAPSTADDQEKIEGMETTVL